MVPRTFKNQKKPAVFFFFNIFCDLGCLLLGCLLVPNLALFWEGFGCQVGPKLAIKSNNIRSNNQPKKMIRLLMASRLIVRGFRLPTWGSSGGPPGVRRATFWLLKPSWIQDGPHIPPRPLQDLPKTPPRHRFKRFWSLLGWIFKGFWTLSGLILKGFGL